MIHIFVFLLQIGDHQRLCWRWVSISVAENFSNCVACFLFSSAEGQGLHLKLKIDASVAKRWTVQLHNLLDFIHSELHILCV